MKSYGISVRVKHESTLAMASLGRLKEDDPESLQTGSKFESGSTDKHHKNLACYQMRK